MQTLHTPPKAGQGSNDFIKTTLKSDNQSEGHSNTQTFFSNREMSTFCDKKQPLRNSTSDYFFKIPLYLS